MIRGQHAVGRKAGEPVAKRIRRRPSRVRVRYGLAVVEVLRKLELLGAHADCTEPGVDDVAHRQAQVDSRGTAGCVGHVPQRHGHYLKDVAQQRVVLVDFVHDDEVAVTCAVSALHVVVEQFSNHILTIQNLEHPHICPALLSRPMAAISRRAWVTADAVSSTSSHRSRGDGCPAHMLPRLVTAAAYRDSRQTVDAGQVLGPNGRSHAKSVPIKHVSPIT